MPTDQQTLFPLRTELAGGLENARISRVKALRKNVISTSYFPHPLKDDKLLLDAKIKWLSLSSFGSVSCQRSSPWRMVILKVLLLIFKVCIHILEVRNILMGLLMLPCPPGSSSIPMEREFYRFIGMEKSARVLFCSCPSCATLQRHLYWVASLGLRDMRWAEAECGPTTQKLGSNLSPRILQETGETHAQRTKLGERSGSCWSQLCHWKVTVVSASLSPSLKQHNTKTLYETIIKGLHVSNRQSLLCFNIHF